MQLPDILRVETAGVGKGNDNCTYIVCGARIMASSPYLHYICTYIHSKKCVANLFSESRISMVRVSELEGGLQSTTIFFTRLEYCKKSSAIK
jgi:hypothetical protein